MQCGGNFQCAGFHIFNVERFGVAVPFRCIDDVRNIMALEEAPVSHTFEPEVSTRAAWECVGAKRAERTCHTLRGRGRPRFHPAPG